MHDRSYEAAPPQEGGYYYYYQAQSASHEALDTKPCDYRFPMMPNSDKQEPLSVASTGPSIASCSTVPSAASAGLPAMDHPMDTVGGTQPPFYASSPRSPSDGASHTPGHTTSSPPDDAAKKRKRPKKEEGEPAEPRRLRRSHEACARCRSKKIKCDSKHPRCSACQAANTQCEQEDRHRQTLTPRGYTEGLEHKLSNCERLLSRFIPNFRLSDLEAICAREGIDANAPGPTSSSSSPSTSTFYPNVSPVNPSSGSELKGVDPHANDVSQFGPQSMAKSFGVSVAMQPPIPTHASPTGAPLSSILRNEDLSVGSASLSSGRDRHLVGVGPPTAPAPRDVRDWRRSILRRASISPGSSETVEIWLPKDLDFTRFIIKVYFERLNIHRPVFEQGEFLARVDQMYGVPQASLPHGEAPQPAVYDEGFICSFFLILALGTLSEANFSSHASTKDEPDSPRSLPEHWPKQEEFFSRALAFKPELRVTLSSLQALILLHWYLYCELQGRNLWRLVGSLVRLSIELGLHHDPHAQFYHPGPSGEGSEDPVPVFTREECALRTRLWGIVLIHDRATSSLLGRPLAIAPNDTNAPTPRCIPGKGGDGFASFSPHFQYSHDLASIQADIVISLYSPNASKNTDGIIRNATRIMRSLADFRKRLGPRYQKYFRGSTASSSPVKMEPALASLGSQAQQTHRQQQHSPGSIMEDLTEDEGLTLLKTGFTRILLLRAIFGNKDLDQRFRMKALTDAISTAHNTIHIHNQLVSFPSVAFFTSPIPLHINAMVILTGHIWHIGILEKHVAVEDVWLALDMLPRFRWRWERKDWGGEHPPLARLVELIMRVDLSTIMGCSSRPIVIEEHEWGYDEDPSCVSPNRSSQSLNNGFRGPSAGTSRGGAHIVSHHGSGGYSTNGSNGGHYSNVYPNPIPADDAVRKAVEIPNSFFYPFFPEQPTNLPMAQYPTPQQQQHQGGASSSALQTGSTMTQSILSQNGPPPDINVLMLQAAVTNATGPNGCQPSQETYFSEERDSEAHLPPHLHPQLYAQHHHYYHRQYAPPEESGVLYSPTSTSIQQQQQQQQHYAMTSHGMPPRPSTIPPQTIPQQQHQPSSNGSDMAWAATNSPGPTHPRNDPHQAVNITQNPRGGRSY